MQPDVEGIAEYQKTLLQWWETNAREYPWRHNRTPYRTALAELMLRRTQADQVVPVFVRFLDRFPSLEEAAGADPEEVRRLLYSLGLAWRTESMLDFFREAHARFGNNLPLDLEQLQSLPGVGDYVGAAIVSFAGNQPAPLIDTNVVRVLGRIFGLSTEGEARRRADMRRLAAMAVCMDAPASYHYAILDFAARICVARKPHCAVCPFSTGGRCQFYQDQMPSS